MRYRSAKSPAVTVVFVLFILLLAAVSVFAALVLSGAVRVLLPILDGLLAAFSIWVYFSTYYVLDPGALLLHSGPLRMSVPYTEIRTVVRTRGYGFFMALAFDRLELDPGLVTERGRVVLSPEREEEFLRELAQRCPGIEIR